MNIGLPIVTTDRNFARATIGDKIVVGFTTYTVTANYPRYDYLLARESKQAQTIQIKYNHT